ATQEEIEIAEQELENRRIQNIKELNVELLSTLVEYKLLLQKCIKQEQFHDLLEDIKSTEERIQIDFLETEQKLLISELTKEYPELIKNKLNEFEHAKVKENNKAAVAEFNEVFKQFKKDEDKYKNNLIQLKRLVSRLFRFETA
ncbi:hypothetical protein B4N84_28255, partial [Flavobacterium sp. IR1]